MADEAKVKIDIGSVEEVGEKLGKGFQESLDALDTKELKKKIDSAFSLSGAKENFANAIKAGKQSTAHQDKMKKILQENNRLSQSFTKSISDGAGKGEIMSKGLSLAKNNIAGMAANMNPYVVALKVGLEVVKQYVKYYQQVLDSSKKFVSAGSLITDRQTMDMMQRTGQSASGAQGTQRSLDMLGISFEDLQKGMVTPAQMKMFEDIRKEETARLEKIQAVAGPTFEKMQLAAVTVSRAVSKVNDSITMAFGKSEGVKQFANSMVQAANEVGDMIALAIDALAPVINIVSAVIALVVKTVSVVAKFVKGVLAGIQPIMNALNNLLNGAFGAIFTILDVVIIMLDAIGPLFDIVKLLGPLLDWITKLFAGMINIILKIVETLLSAVKWVWDAIFGAVNGIVNFVGEAVHSMIRSLVKTVTLGVKDIGEYQEVSVGGKASGALDSAIGRIKEQSTTYNYNNSTTNNNNQNANQNLFANMYTIVND